TATTAGALDGNNAANRTAVAAAISDLNIANGAGFWIRWTDLNPAGSDDGLAVDDFSITPQSVVVPNMTVDDVSASEGDSGTTSFDFTVSLSTPAGAGGVTFDVSTADGTAQDGNPLGEDNDYVAQSLTGQTIPSGSSTYTFSVVVNGDTTDEPNETVLVNLTNVTGATMGDGQGQGTIQNDDAPAQPPPGSVVISEVYGGGGNSGATYTNDFIELYNRTANAISLAGWSVQYAAATGTSWQVTPLAGSIGPGKRYLVQEAAGTSGTLPLPTPDATGAIPMSSTSGKVALVQSAAGLSGGCPTGAHISDFLGYGTANCFEGAGAAPVLTNTTSAQRAGGGATDTDNNAVDFTAGSPNPDNGDEPAPTVTSTNPTNGQANASLSSNISISFSEPVNVSGAWFDISCGTSGSHTAVASGGPTTFTLDPDTDFSTTETCTVTVVAPQVSDQDTDDPLDKMVADFVFIFSTEGPVCQQSFTPIYSIQGSAPSAAIVGRITTQGVVVGDFEGVAAASGFYIQDVTGDGNPATSDGIFVFTGSANVVDIGDVVHVTGFARERFNQTTINLLNSDTAAVLPANIVNCGSGSVAVTDVTMPFAAASFPERYEGMLVRFTQSLVISEYFNYARFGEIVLAQPLAGETRPFTGTAIDEPGAAANARTLANSLRRITLDDAQSAQNPPVLRHPNGLAFSLSNRFRGGDTVENAVGVLGFDFNLYRIYPTGAATYTQVNPRPPAPEPVGGTLHAAAMNTLNYFLTLDRPNTTPPDPLDNKCGGLQNLECRGADSDQPNEFSRQRTKLLAALAGLNADVIGLNEVENTPGVDPVGDIVTGLNDLLGAGTYAAIDTGVIGTDAIRVGLIYKPAMVAPVGGFETLTSADDPRFVDTRSRPALAQTFEQNATGERFTVAVNHLKSKGSACADIGDPDTGDGQGNCNGTRTLAAQALVDWLADDPTGSGDPDFLIMGDLNSYAREDPIDAVKAGPDDAASTDDDYVNLIELYQGKYAYSYTFDGQAGYLDHALANASMATQVTGAADWHINSDEPDVVDYDTTFKPAAQEALYEPNANRSSDHDPVVVGITPAGNAPTITIDQSATQADPTTESPIHFTVTFSEPVAGFDDGDVTLSGTAGADTAVVTGGPMTYDVAVSGMTGGGTVVASVPPGAATDAAGDASAASTSTDNTVTFAVAPVVAVTNGQCSSSNAASGLVIVTITDPDSSSWELELASNSNTGLVPNANVGITGSGANRTIAVTAAPRRSGTTTLTFTVSDELSSVSFVVTVRVGTDGNETVSGTSGTDIILGLGGRDTINGLDGNDLLCGGGGEDVLNGGNGADVLDGDKGDDTLSGGNGDDRLHGQPGVDSLTGGAGADSFSGGAGLDVNNDFDAGAGDISDGT
ncbi:MAG TPA: ExeM/NucH family extracellular endonuclease, partial [Ilumatobacter sp.]|nr:ExeM/NucH family extracellular endonuclease [Ilumatobacter sp.]